MQCGTGRLHCNHQTSNGQKISFLTDYLLIILKALVLSILKTLIQCHIQGQLLSNYLFYPLNPLLFSFPSFKTCITWLDSKMCYSLKKDPGIKFGKLRMMRHDFDSRQYWPKSLYKGIPHLHKKSLIWWYAENRQILVLSPF